MQRGEVWWTALPEPIGRRPVVLLSRDRAIQVRESVTVAVITRTVRDIPVEVPLGAEDGLSRECVANLDNISTVPKKLLAQRISVLSDAKIRLMDNAVKFALGLD